jgi:cobalamin biosynthesis protein CobD/CbiB
LTGEVRIWWKPVSFMGHSAEFMPTKHCLSESGDSSGIVGVLVCLLGHEGENALTRLDELSRGRVHFEGALLEK